MTYSERALLGVAAILALAMLECVAMVSGHDGAYFGIIIMAVAGIAGYSLAQQSAITTLAKAVLPCPPVDAIPMPTASPGAS